MKSIVDEIREVSGLGSMQGCTKEQVEEAQRELGLVFPKEYVDYVRAFGCIDFGATEWTGLNIKGFLNTVYATKKEMGVNPDFPRGCFVLDDIGMDARKVIADEAGKVYMLHYEKKEYLCGSISEYLAMCREREHR